MDILRFDTANPQGNFRILNATNGGPWHKRHAQDQWRTNLEDYKAARFCYTRNHDSAMCGVYGGPYSHDISCIFPNFDLDPCDPASYDFACTDEAILVALDADTETFFRLGQTIEHQIKKHGTLPPKDFKKWAVICEHIIRHYNEGWADGYHLNIQYWEIWNEPDLDVYSDNKRTWGGTPEQFFDFYEITAKHLKSCFPDLKIGGPAICGDLVWTDSFLQTMNERNVPMDFFSWHIYTTNPLQIAERSEQVDELLSKYGYGNAESILNEWNYVRGWGEEYVYSLEAIHGMKGAAFVIACMSVAANTNIDMMMYYDTRPSVFNGCFDYYTYRPLKGYYPFLWYGKFYDGYKQIKALNRVENVYSLCGVNEENKLTAIVTYYAEDDSLCAKEIALDFGKEAVYEVYLLDETHDAALLCETDNLQFKMQRNSCLLIKEKKMNEIKILDMRVQPGDAAYLLDDGETAVLYDTGFGFTGFGVAENIKNYLGDRPLDYIFLTHSHYDHALGSAYVLRYYPNAKVVAGEHTAQVFQRDGAKRVMKDLDAKHAATCGVTDYPFLGDELRVDIQVRDGDIVKAGKMEFEVLWLPGHTNCSVGFYCREQQLLLSTESIGVYSGDRLILPAILVGCKAALASIDRVCALPIKKLVLPHMGLLDDQHRDFFLSHCKKATLAAIDFILTRLQDGKTNDEIVQDFVDEFWHGGVRIKYPIAALRLNTNIMIDLVRKEML